MEFTKPPPGALCKTINDWIHPKTPRITGEKERVNKTFIKLVLHTLQFRICNLKFDSLLHGLKVVLPYNQIPVSLLIRYVNLQAAMPHISQSIK